jgi:hypothetical protein
MALDQSALLNLLGELKLTDVTDRRGRMATASRGSSLLQEKPNRRRDSQSMPYGPAPPWAI